MPVEQSGRSQQEVDGEYGGVRDGSAAHRPLQGEQASPGAIESTRNQRRGQSRVTRRTAGMATAGVRRNVQAVITSAQAGWPGPRSPSNQKKLTPPAMNSMPAQYIRHAAHSPPPCGEPSTSTMFLALGGDSVLTQRPSCPRRSGLFRQRFPRLVFLLVHPASARAEYQTQTWTLRPASTTVGLRGTP
jgi:hypothetical protein